jgi:transcription antitermination factor NusG
VVVALEKAVGMLDCRKCDSISEPGLFQWFALAVKPRFDKAVARALETKGFPTFLPLYTKQHKYAARSKEFELPLFPGYVFCRFNALTRLPILTTPGVTQILGVGAQPIPVDETEIASLRTALKARLRIEPFPYLQVGQKVQIREGALAGVEGIVVSFKRSLRLIVSITLLERSVLLEIDSDQVESLRCSMRSLA